MAAADEGAREEPMPDRFHAIEAEGISVTVDLAVGHLRRFVIERNGQRLTPFHTAPWVEEAAIVNDPDLLPNLKFLSGDFFCAPFGKSDVEAGSPWSHGWPANSPWRVLDEERRGDAVTARFELDHSVMGARLVKEITLRDGHPFAYQTHTFRGGNGAVSAASHAMMRIGTEGPLSFSPKAFGELPAVPQEPDPDKGRSLFATDERFTDLSRLPLADGTTMDLHKYPVGRQHEDFVMLVEEKNAALGWAAAVRPDAGDIVLSLKNPADFPVTFLWFSNGGRAYAPWNGRHIGVLGIEEGRAYSSYGHAASIAPNPLSEAGIPTSLSLSPGGSVSVRHVIGGMPLPERFDRVERVTPGDGRLRVEAANGSVAEAPFDTAFLTGR
jgi:hypothetical protein